MHQNLEWNFKWFYRHEKFLYSCIIVVIFQQWNDLNEHLKLPQKYWNHLQDSKSVPVTAQKTLICLEKYKTFYFIVNITMRTNRLKEGGGDETEFKRRLLSQRVSLSLSWMWTFISRIFFSLFSTLLIFIAFYFFNWESHGIL